MRLLLVDATYYLFRAFHGVDDLRTKDNTPTGALYGLVNMLAKLRRDWPAHRVACVMDAAGKTFRHDLCTDYKANRPPLDPDLRAQIEPAKQFIDASGWTLLCESGVEADDVLATLAKEGKAAGMEVIIASSDKDLMQLVDDQIRIFDGHKDKLYDAAGVREKFGVAPEQIVDYLSLVGDTSDNIRGVEKVGAKTAAKWLGEYGSIAELIAQAEKIGGVVGDNFRRAIADGSLTLARQLITLKTDVSLPLPLQEMIPRKKDTAQWHALCDTYEFQRFKTVLDEDAPPPNNQRARLITITDEETLRQWVAAARQKKAVAVDTETDGSPVMQAHLVGFSLAMDEDTAAYVPLAHSVIGAEIQMSQDQALAILRPLLEDEGVVKIFHNAKYDLHVFANCGITVRGAVDDTKVAAYILSPEHASNMNALAARHLDINTVAYRDVVNGKDAKHFSQVDIETATRYAAEDAEITWKLRPVVVGALHGAQVNIYRNIDRPLIRVLQNIERAGVRIDDAALSAFADEMREQMAALEQEAYGIAGGVFNLNSPRQLEALLFDKFGAKPLRKTAGGTARSTNEATLEKLAPDYPLARVVLAHRSMAKLTNTYADKLPQMVNPHTGRVHTDFNQTSVITGRLASSTPNLQNIPIRTAAGRRIRCAFVAAPGAVLISADYSQIELRLMAHIAGDEALLQAFADGADIHRRTAAEVFGLSEEEVSGEQRRAAKAINFGLMYGMSAFGLARNIDVDQKQAQHYIDRYFSRYPQVAAFIKQTRKQAIEDGFVETIFHRRIPVLTTSGRTAAERAAINAPMQGSAADIIKLAMLETAQWLHDKKMQTQIILQVHDELVLEAPQGEADDVLAALPSLMCGVAELRAPLEVSIHTGANWDIAH